MHGRWWPHLFSVTLVPFSTKLVGLHGNLGPAVFLYAASTILAALSSRQAADLLAAQEDVPGPRGGKLDLMALIATALLSCVLALIAPRFSMYAYFLNAATPLLHDDAWRNLQKESPRRLKAGVRQLAMAEHAERGL